MNTPSEPQEYNFKTPYQSETAFRNAENRVR